MLDTLAIDISKWQQRIDVHSLRREGVGLIIGKLSQGMNPDPKWDAHANTTVQAGLPLAGYHWSDPIVPALEQAEFCAEIAKDYPVTFIGLDLEQWWKSWSEYRVLKQYARRFPASHLGQHAQWMYNTLGKKSSRLILPYSNQNYQKTYCPNLFTWWIRSSVHWIAQWPNAYQPSDNRKGVYITWFDLKTKVVPYKRSPYLFSGVTKAVCWQWTGDRWMLPYVYKLLTGSALSTLDINIVDMLWLNSLGKPPPPPPPPPPEPPPLYTARVIASDGLRVRSKPGLTSDCIILRKESYGTLVDVWQVVGDWSKVSKDLSEWMFSEYLQKI